MKKLILLSTLLSVSTSAFAHLAISSNITGVSYIPSNYYDLIAYTIYNIPPYLAHYNISSINIPFSDIALAIWQDTSGGVFVTSYTDTSGNTSGPSQYSSTRGQPLVNIGILVEGLFQQTYYLPIAPWDQSCKRFSSNGWNLANNWQISLKPTSSTSENYNYTFSATVSIQHADNQSSPYYAYLTNCNLSVKIH